MTRPIDTDQSTASGHHTLGTGHNQAAAGDHTHGGGGYSDEQVRDVVGTALVGGTGVTVTPNDGADTITVASTITQYTDEMVRDAIAAALVAGTNVTITVNDGADTITIDAASGGSGGGFQGQWAAGSYAADDMVAYSNWLWAARASTSAEPLGISGTTTDVAGTAWSRNSCASSASPEVVLINNVGSDTATLISNETFTGWDQVTLEYDIFISGSADWMDLGILDSAQAATVSPGQGLNTQTGFYGVRLDIFNGKVDRYVNGTPGGAGTTVSVSGIAAGAYEKWQMKMVDTGADMQLTLYRAGGATQVASWSFAQPGFTTFRLATGARTGGSAGIFKVHNTPQITAQSADWRKLASLVDLT